MTIFLCFNKKDIATEAEIQKLKDIYEGCGYKMVFTSAIENENVTASLAMSGAVLFSNVVLLASHVCAEAQPSASLARSAPLF